MTRSSFSLQATLITYNPVLTDTHGEEELGSQTRSLRRDAIIEALSSRKLCADVVCLQEVMFTLTPLKTMHFDSFLILTYLCKSRERERERERKREMENVY